MEALWLLVFTLFSGRVVFFCFDCFQIVLDAVPAKCGAKLAQEKKRSPPTFHPILVCYYWYICICAYIYIYMSFSLSLSIYIYVNICMNKFAHAETDNFDVRVGGTHWVWVKYPKCFPIVNVVLLAAILQCLPILCATSMLSVRVLVIENGFPKCITTTPKYLEHIPWQVDVNRCTRRIVESI
jgi:hypothetical protein